MARYFKQVVDGLHGEVGHVYVEDENIVVPEGFVGCLNEMAHVSYYVAFPSDWLEEINESEYKAIEEADYVTEDEPSTYLENPRVQLCREKLAEFKRAALELQEVLCEANYYEMELAGIQDGYPLEQSFDDYDFSEWGEIEKRTPLEEALMFLDTPKYTEMARNNPNEIEVFKAVIKALMIRKSRAMSQPEEEEIDRLLENL